MSMMQNTHKQKKINIHHEMGTLDGHSTCLTQKQTKKQMCYYVFKSEYDRED